MKRFERAETAIKNRAILEYVNANPDEELYLNDVYQVAVRRGLDFPGAPCKITHLSIKRLDKRAAIDWRHFQWIKNELTGPECEGIELYPAETRLVDNANQFHIWVLEDPEYRVPVGWNCRIVTEKGMKGATQRRWPTSRVPDDLDENHQIIEPILKKYETGFTEKDNNDLAPPSGSDLGRDSMRRAPWWVRIFSGPRRLSLYVSRWIRDRVRGTIHNGR